MATGGEREVQTKPYWDSGNGDMQQSGREVQTKLRWREGSEDSGNGDGRRTGGPD